MVVLLWVQRKRGRHNKGVKKREEWGERGGKNERKKKRGEYGGNDKNM